MFKRIRLPKKAKYILAMLVVLLCTTFFAVNWYVVNTAKNDIYTADTVPSADAILVLGAYVFPDGTLSNMLYDRLVTGYELWALDTAPKIIVSGDHGRTQYDEVNAMKRFMMDKGVPGRDVFMDHAGFSTYESMYRARDIFQAKRVVIVTQHYHLSRAIFIARSLGLEAYGVASDRQEYGPVMAHNILREMAARNKDFWLAAVIKPEPTFLGEAIPVFGDGSATDDH